MLTAFNISSMHMRTVIMLRRMTTPTRPTAKSVAESIRKACVLGTELLLHRLLGLGAIDDELRRRLLFLSAQLALADDDCADHGHQQKQRGDLERHEIIAIERHPHSFGVADGVSPGDAAAFHRPVLLLYVAHPVRPIRAQ